MTLLHAAHDADPHRTLWLGAAWLVAVTYTLTGTGAALTGRYFGTLANYYLISRMPHGLFWHGMICLALGSLLAFTLRLLARGHAYCKKIVVLFWVASLYPIIIALTIVYSWWLLDSVTAPASPVFWGMLAALMALVRRYPPLADD